MAVTMKSLITSRSCLIRSLFLCAALSLVTLAVTMAWSSSSSKDNWLKIPRSVLNNPILQRLLDNSELQTHQSVKAFVKESKITIEEERPSVRKLQSGITALQNISTYDTYKTEKKRLKATDRYDQNITSTVRKKLPKWHLSGVTSQPLKSHNSHRISHKSDIGIDYSFLSSMKRAESVDNKVQQRVGHVSDNRNVKHSIPTNYIHSPNSKGKFVDVHLSSSISHKKSESFNVETMSLRRKFPRMMIIGFGKAGTRALYEALMLRPDLIGPKKEPRFFSRHYSAGLKRYLQSLPEPPPNGGWVIEKSPDYITTFAVPERIKDAVQDVNLTLDEVQFVVILRDPIDRAMSEYLEWNLHRQKSQKVLPPFHVMSLGKDGIIDETQPFIRTSNYNMFISRWLKLFNTSRTCFVDGDRFIVNPYSELHLLESCLKLQPYFTESNFVYNKRRGFYCFKTSSTELCMSKSKGRKHPNIPVSLMEKLKEHFRPMANELFQLLGREMMWANFR